MVDHNLNDQKCEKDNELETVIKTVGVVVLSQDKNKVLLVKHTQLAEHETDTFGLPAGRLEINEDNESAAIRELEEETGLKVKSEDLIKLPTIHRAQIQRKTGIKNFELVSFICKSYNGEIRASSENIPIWVEIKELDEIRLLPNVKSIVEEAVSN